LKTTNWKDIAELIGIAAIVVSLAFVGLQLRQEQEIAIVESRGDSTAAMIGLADILRGNGDIWKKGLDGSPMTDAERIEFLALVDLVESQLFTQWIRRSRIGPVSPDGIARGYAYSLYSHPGLRLAWEKNRDWSREEDEAFGVPTGGSDFRQSVVDHLAKLDSEKPPISDDKKYVIW
jgi:hypothetical protein